jgi:hypothetical protein
MNYEIFINDNVFICFFFKCMLLSILLKFKINLNTLNSNKNLYLKTCKKIFSDIKPISIPFIYSQQSLKLFFMTVGPILVLFKTF